MRLAWRALAAVLLVAAALAPDLAAAQGRAQEEEIDPVARQRFQLATTLYSQGQFAEAAEEFERVYEITRNADVLHNVYVAYRDAGEKRKAAEALRGYLAEAQDIPDRAVMEGRLATLERELAEEEERQRQLEEAQREPEREEPLDEPSDVGPAPEPRRPPPVPADGPSIVAPIVVVSAGAALTIGGVVVGLVAADQYETLEEDCGAALICPSSQQDDIDALGTTALVADVLWITGAVATLVGGTWLIIELASGDGETGGSASLQPWCGPRGCGAAVGGTF